MSGQTMCASTSVCCTCTAWSSGELHSLHLHAADARHVNKEKTLLTQFQQRTMQNGGSIPGVTPGQTTKSRDVIYWYLDYREFADVVKYRIAMMRKAIDEKIKNEVGKRGYLCPNCHKVHDPLDLGHLFDPSAGGFLCEVCSTELVEDDPSLHGDEGAGQDRMQRFNVATAPIRDALKSIEGARLPTVNIVAWIALNVATEALPTEGGEAGNGPKFDVVIGEADNGAAQRKLAEEQLAQNSLPAWYTKSTITGESTALGNKEKVQLEKAAAERAAGSGPKKTLDEDDALAAHYANMADEEEVEEDDIEAQQLQPPDTPAESTPAPDSSAAATPAANDITVMVGGKPMRLADIGEAEEEMMTPDEYEAYFDATAAVA